MTLNRKKIFIIAYACEPNTTSEPGVGWNFSNEIAKEFDPIIITRTNNKNNISRENLKNMEFLYYDLPRIFLFLKRKIPLGTQAYYLLWQWGAYLQLRKYLKRTNLKITLAHHLNFGISWIAPPAYLLPIPFVWGPIGGGDTIPRTFLKEMGIKAIAQEVLYLCINNLSKISPFSFLTRKKTNAIIFRTLQAKKNVTTRNIPISKLISETAAAFQIDNTTKKIKKPINVVCVGRMNYWKGYIHAVKGFNSFLKNGGEGSLEIFGEGPEKTKIERYISQNNIGNHIFLHGKVSNETIKKKLKQAHVLLHPSFRDGGSWSIMEAMAFGLPVICLNTSGPKDMVTKDCGILVDMVSPKQVSNDIGKALLYLLQNESVYQRYSRNAVLRIQTEYNWDRRRVQIKEVYDAVLNEVGINKKN